MLLTPYPGKRGLMAPVPDKDCVCASGDFRNLHKNILRTYSSLMKKKKKGMFYYVKSFISPEDIICLTKVFLNLFPLSSHPLKESF